MQLNKYCKSQKSNTHNSSHAFSNVPIYSAMSILVPGTDLTVARRKLRKAMHPGILTGNLGSGM